MNPNGALIFLIDTVFNVYCFIVLARFLLQIVKADFYNPVSQIVLKSTDPILNPLRRILPGFGGIDVASRLLLVALQILKVIVMVLIVHGSLPPVLYILMESLKGCASLTLDFFLFSIFIMVILSWVSQGSYNPLAELLRQITEPILGPVRKIMPSMGGLDLSPMIVAMLILFLKQLFMLH